MKNCVLKSYNFLFRLLKSIIETVLKKYCTESDPLACVTTIYDNDNNRKSNPTVIVDDKLQRRPTNY